jgi:transposase InsO family protein
LGRVTCVLTHRTLVHRKRPTEHKVKIVHSDNGGNFTSKALRTTCARSASSIQPLAQLFSADWISQRANRTIVQSAVALLYSERLLLSLWAEVMNAVLYLKNRWPTRSLKGQTPLKEYSRIRPDLSKLRVIG